MWYAIICEDHQGSLERRLEARPAHVSRLEELVTAGRLLTAGPHPAIDADEPGEAGFSGSLIIAEFASLEDACDWADDDPYVKAGVYRNVSVLPYKRVLP